MRFPDLLRPVSCVFFAAGLLVAQTSKQSDVLQSQDKVKAATRLVVVDVVVTDKQGEPVKDLKPEDFNVLENGAPQKISDFAFNHLEVAAPSATRQLPPNVVTNAPTFQSGVLDVILFDSVNGDFTSQSYAKDQLSKFFSVAKLDRPVALFALETRVKLLQDFTVDGSALKNAIEKYKQVTTGAQTESFESRESPFSTKGDYHTSERNIETTLNQLNVLAKILSGYPGRKNLIWLSESFPLNLYPDTVLPSGINVADVGNDGGRPSKVANVFDTMVAGGSMKDFAGLVKKVAEAMANAKVAVYPVDAAGVGKNDHLASIHTANDMAERTGGRAFHNTNDLAGSMQASVTDGASYYTLSYYPDNKKWDGQFRVIHIRTSRPGLTLRYRLGYYALDPEKMAKDNSDRVAEDFSRSLQLDLPAATGVRFQAGIVPPSSQDKDKVIVNFAVDPHTLQFQRGSDGTQRANVVCVVWAYGKDRDKPVMSPGKGSKADLKSDVFEQVMKQYYPCKEELQLKAGTYTLKLGVLDRNSNRMGTTTAMVTVP